MTLNNFTIIDKLGNRHVVKNIANVETEDNGTVMLLDENEDLVAYFDEPASLVVEDDA